MNEEQKRREMQVEEMAQIINGSTEIDTAAYYRCMNISKTIYNAGYRVVPDGAVILTPEERDEEMKEINKTLAERDELKAENERLKEVIADQNELCWNCKKSVKEFAEKLRKKVISLNVWEFGEIDIIDVDDIDELLKEYEE